MRRFLPLVTLMFLAAMAAATAGDSTVADLQALEGKALFKAADEIGFDHESKFSSADLVKIAERLGEHRKKLTKQDKDNHAFSRFFEAACMKATSQEVDKLIDIYLRLEPDSFDKQLSFQPLAAAWILREIASLDSGSIKIPAYEKPPPPQLADAPPEVVDAWKAYKSATDGVVAAFRAATPEKKQISFQVNENAFFRLLDDVLLKRGEKVAEQLAEFSWSGWCGTGANLLFEPRSIGIFMSLLRERRMPEAVGAAIEMQSDELLLAGSDRADVRIAFLTKCGVDWESIFAGAQIDRDLEGFPIWGTPHLIELTAYGSEKAARLVAKMALRAKPECHEPYASALAAFASERSEEAAYYFSGRGFTRVAKTPVSKEIQADAIGILQRFATPQASPEVALTALKAFERANLASTIGTIRSLLKHPSPEVSQEAAQILRSMGEPVEMAEARTAPLRFQVFVNGSPMASDAGVSWEVRYGACSGTSGIRDSDADGFITLERKYFLDGQRKATEIILSSLSGESPAEPYFHVTLPVPEDLDQVTQANAEVWPLELQIQRMQRPVTGDLGKGSVKLQRREEKLDSGSRPDSMCFAYFDRMERTFEASIDDPVTLSMQSGTYELQVLAPGTEKYKTTFTLGAKASRLDVRLKPGGDFRVQMVRPDGERGARSDLLRDGKKIECDYDRETNTCRGLPVGNYVLHILSSAEAISKDGDSLDYAPIQPYAGRDVPFTIVGNAGEPVDLGEIRLEGAAD